MKSFFLGLVCSGVLFGVQSAIELPLRIEYAYSKRVPGKTEFFYITRLPSTEVIAIPESEIGRFITLAVEEGLANAQMGDYHYLPSNQNAVGEIAKATVTIEHTGELRFWINRDGYWITWDDEHPAPIPTLNGTEITEWSLAEVPMGPNPMIARPR